LPSYEHKKLVEEIKSLDELPQAQRGVHDLDPGWAHLEFLRRNARSEAVVIYGSGEYSFMHAVVIPNDRLASLSQDDLLNWGGDPIAQSRATSGGAGRDDVCSSGSRTHDGSRELKGIIQLVFGRTFEGWSGSDRTYFEVNQEYTAYHRHSLAPEQRAYCRYDETATLSRWYQSPLARTT